MDDLGIRDDHVRGIERIVQSLNDALGHMRGCAAARHNGRQRAVRVVAVLIKGRYIHALDLHRLAQEALFIPAFALSRAVKLQHLTVQLLTFTDDKQIDKISQRLGIEHARAARDDKMLQLRAILGPHGDFSKAQHVENVCVAHLVADRESDDVKLVQRIAAFQCVKRQIVAAQRVLHVCPRRKDAFAPHPRHAVERRVQNAHSEIRHADLISIREAERHAQLDLAARLDDLVVFSAHIPRRLLHGHKDAFQCFCHYFSSFICKIRRRYWPYSVIFSSSPSAVSCASEMKPFCHAISSGQAI